MKHRGSSQTVSFRLSGKLLQELERQAEEFGLSPGEMSRGGHEHEKVDLLVAKFFHSQSRGQDTKLHVH